MRCKDFVLHDIWEIELSSLSHVRRFVVKVLRVSQLVVRGFGEDECLLHASALTYVTLMALIPLLAIVFSILKGLGAGQDALDRMMELLSTMPDQFRGFVENLLVSVSEANVAAVGWIGVIALLIMVVQMLSSIETSFNMVWGIKTSRNLLRKTANYISILVVVPILIMTAVTVTATLSSDAFIQKLGLAGPAYRSMLRLTPVLASWLAFTFLYVFMPNTRVHLPPALVSGLAATLLWLGWQRLYIALQVGVARYNVLYGTFLSVPIFLMWVYFSWVIVLLGAEIAFAIQNHATYQMERSAHAASTKSKLLLALSVVVHAAKAQQTDRPLFETAGYAREHRVPVRLLNEIIRVLVKAGLLAETAEKQGCYVLLRAPEKIRARDVIGVIMQDGTPPETLGLLPLDPEIDRVLRALDESMTRSLNELTIRDLLQEGVVNR
ncbi:MAG: YhjD/YihY/BrkB family envelope integrity protein [Verrucomicrobiota bacterium]